MIEDILLQILADGSTPIAVIFLAYVLIKIERKLDELKDNLSQVLEKIERRRR